MLRSRVVLAAGVALFIAIAGSSSVARADSPTTQEIMITVSGGTQLACELVLPAGSPPAGGWPGLLLFEPIGPNAASTDFAAAGLASLACEPRGSGSSGGLFDLAGPTDVQDARALFDWLATRSDVSDTEIGAFGEGVGGAEAWNAAVAGVPFRAIVPGLTWTSLGRALTPDGVVKSGLLSILGPPSKLDPTLTQARQDLTRGQVTAAVKQALAKRSSLGRLDSLTVPTLMVQNRRDSLFDLGQATAAYRHLAGPRRLYIGPPTRALPEIVAWFEEYLTGGAPVGGGVELAHAPWDGTTTSFTGVPPTRTVAVNVLGAKNLTNGVLHRSLRLPGGPFETFGGGAITVRYSGASDAWQQIAAMVWVRGKKAPVTQGAAPISTSSGVVRIPLLDEVVLLPRGKQLVVRLGPTTWTGIFNGTPLPPPAERTITIERATLNLSVLRRAVSR